MHLASCPSQQSAKKPPSLSQKSMEIGGGAAAVAAEAGEAAPMSPGEARGERRCAVLPSLPALHARSQSLTRKPVKSTLLPLLLAPPAPSTAGGSSWSPFAWMPTLLSRRASGSGSDVLPSSMHTTQEYLQLQQLTRASTAQVLSTEPSLQHDTETALILMGLSDWEIRPDGGWMGGVCVCVELWVVERAELRSRETGYLCGWGCICGFA